MRGTDRWLDNPLILKVVSVLIAIVIWMYVSYSPNIGKIEKIMEVKVSAINVPNNTVVDYTPVVVEVNVMGFKEDISQVSSKEIRTYIDLKGLSSGKYRVPVVVKAPPGVRIVKVKPAKISVSLLSVKKRMLDVMVSVIGFPPDGYVADQPVVSPKQVEVEGSEQMLKKVKFAVVSVDMNGLKSSIKKMEPVMIVDSNGKEVRTLRVVPREVEITVNVRKGWPQKVVPIKPVLKGRLPEMWTVERVEVKPSSVVIEGPRERLNAIRYLTLYIPVDGLKNKINTLVIPVPLPYKDVRVMEKQKVTVTVSLSEKLIEKRFELPVVITGKSVFKKWRVFPTAVRILLKGKYSVIRKAKPVAYIDVSNIVSRKKKLRVSVKVPKGVDVVNVDPEEVTVEVVE